MSSTNLVVWLRKFGAVIDDDLEWPVYFLESGRGVACSRNLQKREVLLRIPEALTLTPEKCFEGGLKSLFQSIVLDEYVMIALFLLQEMSKVIISDFLASRYPHLVQETALFQSPWEPYIRTLPSSTDILGIYYSWEDEEKSLINDPLMRFKGSLRTMELTAEYERIVTVVDKVLHSEQLQSAYPSDAQFTAHLLLPVLMNSMGPFMWAVGCVTSRAFLHGLNVDYLFQTSVQCEKKSFELLPSHFRSPETVRHVIALLQRHDEVDAAGRIPIAVLPLADMFNHKFDAPEIRYTCSCTETLGINKEASSSKSTMPNQCTSAASSATVSSLLHDTWQSQHIHKLPRNKNYIVCSQAGVSDEYYYVSNLKELWKNTFLIPKRGDTFKCSILCGALKTESSDDVSALLREKTPASLRKVLETYCFIDSVPNVCPIIAYNTNACNAPTCSEEVNHEIQLAPFPEFISNLSLNGYYELRTASPYTAGAELLISYGDRTSRDLLENYGFSIPLQLNRCETLSLPLSHYFSHSFPVAPTLPAHCATVDSQISPLSVDSTLLQNILYNHHHCSTVKDQASQSIAPQDSDVFLGVGLLRKFLFDLCQETFEEIELPLPEGLNMETCFEHIVSNAVQSAIRNTALLGPMQYRQLCNATFVHTHVLQLFRTLLLDESCIKTLSSSLRISSTNSSTNSSTTQTALHSDSRTHLFESLETLASNPSESLQLLNHPVSYVHELSVTLVIVDLLLTELILPYSDSSPCTKLRTSAKHSDSHAEEDPFPVFYHEDSMYLQTDPLLPRINRSVADDLITTFRKKSSAFIASVSTNNATISNASGQSISSESQSPIHEELRFLLNSIEACAQIFRQLYFSEILVSTIHNRREQHLSSPPPSDDVARKFQELLVEEPNYTSSISTSSLIDTLDLTSYPQLESAQLIDTKHKAQIRLGMANIYRRNRLLLGFINLTNYLSYFLRSLNVDALKMLYLDKPVVSSRTVEQLSAAEMLKTGCASQSTDLAANDIFRLNFLRPALDEFLHHWDGICLEVQEQWAQMILSREKRIEVRTYPLPTAYEKKKIGLWMTPPGGSQRCGLGSGKLVGIVTFARTKRYNSEKEWNNDEPFHKVPPSDPYFSYHSVLKREGDHVSGPQTVYGWEIDLSSIMVLPIMYCIGVQFTEKNRIHRSLFRLS